ncbi:hypothetical protein CYY_005741 [Polysphondylium violaceum]|uniref:EamA domain-containing protein n=1 Tax=Polysphondylium violaceum TaxID=133409 RepID=A0A8J4PRG8_9MYCE|nr:hypothetical protein CYY_005741 [Polysphondylium violaceum]
MNRGDRNNSYPDLNNDDDNGDNENIEIINNVDDNDEIENDIDNSAIIVGNYDDNTNQITNNNQHNNEDLSLINNDNNDINKSKPFQLRRHIIGTICILAVVFLWVFSGVMTQIIFTEEDYNKPFFLTYFATSIFTFYLLGFGIKWRTWLSIPFSRKQQKQQTSQIESYQSLNNSDNVNIESNQEQHSRTKVMDPVTGIVKNQYHFTIKEILKISLCLCPIWFCANYTYNLSLSRTSVSTNTILSTLSGLFSLFLSVAFKVDKFSIEKLLAALITLSGIIMVSYSSLDKSNNGNDTVLGDGLAVVGAFFYGLYGVLIKKLVISEEYLPMPMLLGFLGLFNFLFLWPLFIVFNLVSFEVFQLPSWRVFLFLVFNGLFGSFLSDLLDSYSVVMTSPMINSIGLSLSIPLAMISDFVRSHRSFGPLYIVGSIFVVFGFILANMASSVLEDRLKAIEQNLLKRFKKTLKI